MDYQTFAIAKPAPREKSRPKGLKRTGRIRPKPRKDPISTDLRNRVLRRDGRCFASMVIDGVMVLPGHRCHDMTEYHAPTDLGRLTYEHIKWVLRMGKRAEPDEFHAVALCRRMN